VSHVLKIERMLKLATWERAKLALSEMWILTCVSDPGETPSPEHAERQLAFKECISRFVKEVEERGFIR